MADVSNIAINGTSYALKDAKAARKGMYVGTCTTAANTYAKVATVDTFPVDGNGKPLEGTIVGIKYSNSNSYKTAGQYYTLDVNNTGAYRMYYNNAELATSTSANTLVAGYKNRYIYYMFDDDRWVWLGAGNDTNTTYSGMTAAEIEAGTSTTARLITPKNLRDYFYTEDEVDALLADKADADDLATVATSGSYNDLTNKPTIPAAVTVDSSLTGSSQTNPVQGGAIYSALQGKEDRQRVIIDIQCEINYIIGYSVGGNTITGEELYALCADPKKDVVLRIIGYDNNEDDDPDYSDDILYYRIQDSLSGEYEIQYFASWWNGMFLLVGLIIESEGANIYFDAGIEEFSYVPTYRKINNKPLSTDITLTASDVGALPSNTDVPSITYNSTTTTLTIS